MKAANNKDRYYQPRAAVPAPPDIADGQTELTKDRVRRIIDDDATGPLDVDPETIRAARRIARRLEQS